MTKRQGVFAVWHVTKIENCSASGTTYRAEAKEGVATYESLSNPLKDVDGEQDHGGTNDDGRDAKKRLKRSIPAQNTN